MDLLLHVFLKQMECFIGSGEMDAPALIANSGDAANTKQPKWN